MTGPSKVPSDLRRPANTGMLPFDGVGWYRKKFDISSSDSGKQIYLDIDGAMSHAAVWCNGHFAGEDCRAGYSVSASILHLGLSLVPSILLQSGLKFYRLFALVSWSWNSVEMSGSKRLTPFMSLIGERTLPRQKSMRIRQP